MSELKPCPFCGGEAELHGFHDLYWVVECVRCYASANDCDTEQDAIEAWNTRVERTCRVTRASRKYVLSDGTELFDDGCSECNGYLQADDNYCPNCGARVTE